EVAIGKLMAGSVYVGAVALEVPEAAVAEELRGAPPVDQHATAVRGVHDDAVVGAENRQGVVVASKALDVDPVPVGSTNDDVAEFVMGEDGLVPGRGSHDDTVSTAFQAPSTPPQAASDAPRSGSLPVADRDPGRDRAIRERSPPAPRPRRALACAGEGGGEA